MQLIRSFITYGASSWSTACRSYLQSIQEKENKILRKITGVNRCITNSKLKRYLGHKDLVEAIHDIRDNELQKLHFILNN